MGADRGRLLDRYQRWCTTLLLYNTAPVSGPNDLAPSMAGHGVIVVVFKRRLSRIARRLGMTAPASEDAAGRKAGRARRFPRQPNRLAGPRIEARHRFKQRAGIGVARRGEQFFRRGQFDDAAEIHDRYAIAEPPDNR